MKKMYLKILSVVFIASFFISCDGGSSLVDNAPTEIKGTTFSFTIEAAQNVDYKDEVGKIAIATFYKDGSFKLFWQQGNPNFEEGESKKAGFKYGKGTYEYKKTGDNKGELTWKTDECIFVTQFTFTSKESAQWQSYEEGTDSEKVNSGVARFK
jgi:hypothetical protein